MLRQPELRHGMGNIIRSAQGRRDVFSRGVRIRGYNIDVNRHTENCIGRKVVTEPPKAGIDELLQITDTTLYQVELLFVRYPPICSRLLLRNCTQDKMLIQIISLLLKVGHWQLPKTVEKITIAPLYGKGTTTVFDGDQVNRMLQAWIYLNEQTKKQHTDFDNY